MNPTRCQSLWILAMAGGFAVANPHTLHAPTSTASAERFEGQLVPQDHYLDLGRLQRGPTSATTYTAVVPLTLELALQAQANLLGEHRYLDLARPHSQPAAGEPPLHEQ